MIDNFYASNSFIRVMSSVKKIFGVLVLLLVGGVWLFSSGCRKDNNANASLSFSTDTLTFDTVFATLGSTTKYFKVFNTSSKPVTIEDLRLMRLVGNQFRMNVDGINGDQFSNIEIPAKDSIYVFVEVTVNPNAASTPFVIIDDVSFLMNGKQSTVHLQAFGQNAHFHYGEEIASGNTETWNNDLPHVIISKDTVPGVYVRCGATLNINPGCKIFFAGNSALFVEGTLNANAATWSDSIVFQGARLEEFYDDKPGQWFGIVFLRNGCAPQGSFNHCVVNESSYGIYAGAGLSSNLNEYLGAATRPNVSIKNSIVKNTQFNAVQGFNAKIEAENSLFYVSGDNLVKLWLGGDYKFTHCTLYNTGSRFVSHEKEILVLNNAVIDGNNVVYPEPINSVFNSCVIYGSLQNEIEFGNVDGTNLGNFVNEFNYSLLKAKSDTVALFSSVNNANLFNQDPRFKEPNKENFTPSDSAGYFSPIIDFAPSFSLSTDFFDKPRPVAKTSNANLFDAGAVEAQ